MPDKHPNAPPAGAFFSSRLPLLRLFAWLLLPLALTAAVYSSGLDFPLVFDDQPFFRAENLSQLSTFTGIQFRWLAYATFGWTYALVGQGDWYWYRVGNLAIHLANGVLLLVFISRLHSLTETGHEPARPLRQWGILAAAFFLLNPSAVYSVAYLVQRSIELAVFFSLAALVSFTNGLISGQKRWFVSSLTLFAAAILCKEHAVMLFAPMVLLTFLAGNHRSPSGRFRVVLLAALSVVVISAIIHGSSFLAAAYEPLASSIYVKAADETAPSLFLLSQLNQSWLFFRYLALWILPDIYGMSIDIRPEFPAALTSFPWIWGPFLFMGYGAFAAFLLSRRGHTGLVGWGLLFPWLMFLTEVATIRIQEPFVLYRSYLWMPGLSVTLAVLLSRLDTRWFVPLLSGICLALTPLAFNRIQSFSSSASVWQDVIDKHSGKTGRIGLDRAWLFLAEDSLRNQRYEEALRHVSQARLLAPDSHFPDKAEGLIYHRMQQYEKAYNAWQTARSKARVADPSLQMGMIDVLIDWGKEDEALKLLNKYLSAHPQSSAALYKSSMLLRKRSEPQKSWERLNQSIAYGKYNPAAFHDRAQWYMAAGDTERAMADVNRAISLDGQDASYRTSRSTLFMLRQDWTKALADIEIAIRNVQSGVDRAQLIVNRGVIHLKSGAPDAARRDFIQGCRMGNPMGCKLDSALSRP